MLLFLQICFTLWPVNVWLVYKLTFIQHCSWQCPSTYIMTSEPHNNPVRKDIYYYAWFSTEETRKSKCTISYIWESSQKSNLDFSLYSNGLILCFYYIKLVKRKNKGKMGAGTEVSCRPWGELLSALLLTEVLWAE